MKKLFICLIILCMAGLPALAETDRVVDEAGLLSAYEESQLEDTIGRIAAQYEMDVAIVTKDGIGFRSINVYTADYFEAAGYGLGPGKDGLIFLMDMEEREYFTATHGEAITIFTDYGLDTIHDKIVGRLSAGDYFGAFERYLAYVEKYLADYRQAGVIYDYGNRQKAPLQERFMGAVPIVFLVALGIGLIVSFSLKGQLKTVRRKGNALNYVRQGSFSLSRSQDIYLYTRTTRRRIETNTSSGSRGGSSTFRSSSGGSFGGRGGRF